MDPEVPTSAECLWGDPEVFNTRLTSPYTLQMLDSHSTYTALLFDM